MVQRIKYRLVPLRINRLPIGLHVVETQILIIRKGNIPLGCGGLLHHESHVRLSRTKPHLAYRHMAEDTLLLTRTYCKCRASLGFLRRKGNLPVALLIGTSGLVQTSQLYLNCLSCIGFAMNRYGYTSLQNHIVGINSWQVQATIIACNAAINHFCHDTSTFCIGMYGIGQQKRIRI